LPPELANLEKALTERLGTRVQIEPREKGGKVHIDFFAPNDVAQLLALLNNNTKKIQQNNFVEKNVTENLDKEVQDDTKNRILSPLCLFTSSAISSEEDNAGVCEVMEDTVEDTVENVSGK